MQEMGQNELFAPFLAYKEVNAYLRYGCSDMKKVFTLILSLVFAM